MYLLIDTVSPRANYILFDDERTIVSQESLDIRGQESERFLASLQEFLTKHHQEYKSLSGVIVVNGPGSFTAMRIITLTINTLSFVHYVPLYSVDYFHLGHTSGWSFPIVIKANRGEYLIQETRDQEPKLIALADIAPGTYFGIGDGNDFTNGTISIQSNLSYESFCKNFQIENPVKRIEPLYIKKPNIT